MKTVLFITTQLWKEKLLSFMKTNLQHFSWVVNFKVIVHDWTSKSLVDKYSMPKKIIDNKADLVFVLWRSTFHKTFPWLVTEDEYNFVDWNFNRLDKIMRWMYDSQLTNMKFEPNKVVIINWIDFYDNDMKIDILKTSLTWFINKLKEN